MPDTKKKVVYYEGDDDKAFLKSLDDANLLPSGWQLAKRDKDRDPGKDGIFRELLPFISPINGADGRAIVLVDLDEKNREQCIGWFRTALEKSIRDLPSYAGVSLDSSAEQSRIPLFRLTGGNRVGHVVFVPVGCPEDDEVNRAYRIDRFAIDDWVFRLALSRTVFERVSDFAIVGHDVAVAKFTEVADVFRKNGLEVRKAKIYVQILRAVAAIGPSTATIVGRLVANAIDALGKEAFQAMLKPLLDDLAEADRLLSVTDNTL